MYEIFRHNENEPQEKRITSAVPLVASAGLRFQDQKPVTLYKLSSHQPTASNEVRLGLELNKYLFSELSDSQVAFDDFQAALFVTRFVPGMGVSPILRINCKLSQRAWVIVERSASNGPSLNRSAFFSLQKSLKPLQLPRERP